MRNLLIRTLPEVFYLASVNLIDFPVVYAGKVFNGRAVDQNFVLVVFLVITQAHEPVMLEVVEKERVCGQTIQFPI